MGANNTQGTYREAISVDNLTRFQTHTLHCPGDTVHVNSTAKVYHTCTSPISPSDVILNSIHFQLMFLHSNFTFCLFQSAFSLKPKTGRLRIQFLGKVYGLGGIPHSKLLCCKEEVKEGSSQVLGIQMSVHPHKLRLGNSSHPHMLRFCPLCVAKPTTRS